MKKKTKKTNKVVDLAGLTHHVLGHSEHGEGVGEHESDVGRRQAEVVEGEEDSDYEDHDLEESHEVVDDGAEPAAG